MKGNPKRKNDQKFPELVSIVSRLRGRHGCPWDKAQDANSLKPYLIEESYELLSALDSGNEEHVKEELGDLLLQIMLLSRIYEEKGSFSVYDVIDSISWKLVHRHPHVFGKLFARTPDDVVKIWASTKSESRRRRSLLDGIPNHLPSLLKAQRTSERAARIGFDWPSLKSLKEKLAEELKELSIASTKKRKEEELGDVLFVIVNIARRLGINAEMALRNATRRFTSRFHYIEKALGKKIHSSSLKELDRIWNKAKLR